MNGATALDWENTISSPNRTNTTTIGTSQYFFSCFRNCQNSDKTRPLLILTSHHQRHGAHGQRDSHRNQMYGEPAGIRDAPRDQAADDSAKTTQHETKRQPSNHRHVEHSANRLHHTANDQHGPDVEPGRILDGDD